jgi:TonB family protein
MSKAAFIFVVLIATANAGAASAAGVAPYSIVMGDPVHIKAPTAAELEGVKPSAARAGGSAELGCRVANDGRLQDCVVLRERPVRSGFGQAAVRLVQRMHTGPVDNERAPTSGVVTVPVVFGQAG